MHLEKKTKVICDANVWYRLGEHSLPTELEGSELYISSLTLLEIISSGLQKNEFFRIKGAIAALSKYGSTLKNGKTSFNVMTSNDAQVIILVQKPDYKDDLTEAQKENINMVLDELLKAQALEELSYDFDSLIITRKLETKNWRENIKAFILNLKDAGTTDLDQLHDMIFDYILGPHVKAYLEKYSPATEFAQIDLRKFELFIDSFARYLLKKMGNSSPKVENNDYIDYMNLLYCIDDYKYLSFDEGLNDILRSSQYSKKYLLPIDVVRGIKEKINPKKKP